MSNRWNRWQWTLVLVALIGVSTVSAVQMSLLVRRTLPTAVTDGTGATARAGRYGETMVIPLTAGLYALADEGSYWHAQTATPGTAYNLAGATQTAWVATTPTFHVKNNDAANAKRLYVDYARVVITAAGTGITRIEGAAIIDSAARYSSGGTALTAYNVNMDLSPTSITANLFGGVVTATAATAPRYVCRFTLSTAAPVAGDSFLVNFGAMDTATANTKGANCGPALVGGGASFLIYLWFPGSTATATGEIDAGWWER